MARFARTCALGFLVAGGTLVVACGHLPFDDLSLEEAEAGSNSGDSGFGPGPDSGRDPGAVDSGADGAAPDAGCFGPTCAGTFVSGTTGADSNPGTAEKPVATIMKGIEIATALGGKQSVYIASTHYPEKVTLSEGVDVLGGYDCSAASCTWARDVVKNDTAILDQDDEGVVAPKTVTRKTQFDGFRVVGKGGPVSDPPGRAALSLVSGTPTITRCRIVGGDVTGGANAKSIGIAVLGPSNDGAGALIVGNTIIGGGSNETSIGLLFDTKVGGAAGATTVAVVTANVIRSGVAPFTSAVVALTSGPGTLLKDNDIVGGTSSLGGGGSSGSWGITVQSTMRIDANRINADSVNAGGCTQSGNGNFCGGIQSQGSTTTIVNNVVLGGKGPRTCAVLLMDGEQATGSVVLNGNTLDGAGNAGNDGTLSSAIALRIREGDSASLGKIRNNILLGGLNKNRYGVYEDGPSGKTAKPAALDNNDFWHAGTPKTDFAYRVWNGNAGTNVTFAQLGTIPTPTPNANLNVDPLLDATYHLSKASPLVDKGTSTEAPDRDIDGESRPKGSAVDIGADEVK